MTLVILYLLALLDGLLCGLRASMGRCPLLNKRSYYARSLFEGLVGAQIISTLSLAAVLATFAVSSDRTALRSDLEAAAGRMLFVFLPYAGLVAVNLALRLLPSTDIRSATSVFMLGPLTAIRPLVMVAGLARGMITSRLLETRLLGFFVLALMLTLEYALNRRAARAQSLQIRRLVDSRNSPDSPKGRFV